MGYQSMIGCQCLTPLLMGYPLDLGLGELRYTMMKSKKCVCYYGIYFIFSHHVSDQFFERLSPQSH